MILQIKNLKLTKPKMGQVESPISIFMTKYCDKEYTKQDLENPSVFNMDEIDEIANSVSIFYNREEKRGIIAQCVDIVKANPGATLSLKETPDNTGFNFNIQLRNGDNTYDFRENTYHKGVKGISMWTTGVRGPHMFHHSSDIGPYFRIMTDDRL